MPKIYQVLRNSANYIVRKGQGKLRCITVLPVSVHVQDISIFLLILTPLKLINTGFRKSRAGLQHFRFERSIGDILDQCYSEMFSNPPVNCLLLGRDEASTAIAHKHWYTYIAICQNNFMSFESNRNLGLVFCMPFLILPFLVIYFYGVLQKYQ